LQAVAIVRNLQALLNKNHQSDSKVLMPFADPLNACIRTMQKQSASADLGHCIGSKLQTAGYLDFGAAPGTLSARL
jgi:hypothetical protein